MDAVVTAFQWEDVESNKLSAITGHINLLVQANVEH